MKVLICFGGGLIFSFLYVDPRTFTEVKRELGYVSSNT